jgi:hypothetical protein
MRALTLVSTVLALIVAPAPRAYGQVDEGAEGGSECPDCEAISFVELPGGDVRASRVGEESGGVQVCGLDPASCAGGAGTGAGTIVEVGGPGSAAGTASAAGAGGAASDVAPLPACSPVASVPTPANIGLVALPAAQLGHDPYVTGLTGLDTGVWYEGSAAPVSWAQVGTLGVRADCSTYQAVYGGYAAAPVEYLWHFDEDGVVRSSASDPGSAQAWAAQHEYGTKGDYTLAVQVRWGVVGSPGGGGGFRSVYGYADHPVIEIRSVLVGG